MRKLEFGKWENKWYKSGWEVIESRYLGLFYV